MASVTIREPLPQLHTASRRVPIWAWHVGRVLSVCSAIGLCVLLLVEPDKGLELWWKLAIPSLPLLWLTAPGLWRNLCPLAASNQTPRLFKFTRGLTIPDWYREYAPVVGMTAFILLVASREPLLNTSGVATAVLIGASLVGALVGGVVFKGKSGWCSSLCPLLPVQRIYGQTPFATVPNSHCQPCVGCTKNCYDFNPRVAYLADLYEDDRHYTGYRKFFVGCFPGLILCYFTLPEHISAASDYGRFALYIAASAGSFFLAEALLKVTVNKITAVYGAVAISLFYWYASQVLAGTITGSESDGVVRVGAARRGVGAGGGVAGAHMAQGGGVRRAGDRAAAGAPRRRGARRGPRPAGGQPRDHVRAKRPAPGGEAWGDAARSRGKRRAAGRGGLPDGGVRRGPGVRRLRHGASVAGLQRRAGDARASRLCGEHAHGLLCAGQRAGRGVADA